MRDALDDRAEFINTLQCHPGGWSADADGADQRAFVIISRRRHTANAIIIFFVVDGVTTLDRSAPVAPPKLSGP